MFAIIRNNRASQSARCLRSSGIIELHLRRLVSRWLTGLGHVVHDLGDPALQEELVSSPEVRRMALTMVMMTTMVMMMSIANNEQDTFLSFEEQDDYFDISRHYFLQAWIMDKLEDGKTKVAVLPTSQ